MGVIFVIIGKMLGEGWLWFVDGDFMCGFGVFGWEEEMHYDKERGVLGVSDSLMNSFDELSDFGFVLFDSEVVLYDLK